MDRIISILAALVGLIALAGAVLVQTHTQSEQRRLETEFAAMKAAMQQLDTMSPVASRAPAVDDTTTKTIAALQDRIATLEAQTRDQGKALAELQLPRPAYSTTGPSSSAVPEAASTMEAAAASQPAPSSEPTASVGPTTECIPLGTRFMGKAGDSFPICRTPEVVKVESVDASTVVVNGTMAIDAGGFSRLGSSGCTVMVFSADGGSGYAELRVTC
jgi:hypothetical protein